MSHDDLIERARLWLIKQGCKIVVTNCVSHSSETPDAIGFKSGGRSLLVECKTSRSDFRADAKKLFRNDMNRFCMGMGFERYFMTAPNLIKVEEVPRKWGLLEVREARTTIVRPSGSFKRSGTAEVTLLMSVIRRGIRDVKGVSGTFYTIENGSSKATIGAEIQITNLSPCQ